VTRKASIIGGGPNGLSAAIVLADAGIEVDVYEAEPTVGGAARTMELTLPGFRHDFGSAVHPMGVGSPFFASLPLQSYGLEWLHSPAPLAHPLDDGTAVVLERRLEDAVAVLGYDGHAWRDLMEPFVSHWHEFAPEVLRPVHLLSRHPFLMARLGLKLLRSARSIASRFQSEPTRALFGGVAAHSFLCLDEAPSGVFGIMIAVAAHAVGWPIPRGGSQAISDSLCAHLAKLGGKVHTSARVNRLQELPQSDVILCDITPRQLLRIAGDRLSSSYRKAIEPYRYGPGAFKVDYALSQPIPWKAKDCLRAATIHIGGSFEEIALSEKLARNGEHASLASSIRRVRRKGSTLPGLTAMFLTVPLSICFQESRIRSNALLLGSAIVSSQSECSRRPIWRRWMRTLSAETLPAARWICGSSYSGLPVGSMPLPTSEFICVRRRRRPERACMACAVTMPPSWLWSI